MQKKHAPPFSAAFQPTKPASTVRPTYRLSRQAGDGTRRLVQTGTEDIREMIKSNYQSSFDYLLDRFLDSGEYFDAPNGAPKEDQSFLWDTLDILAEGVEMLETIRETYDLSPDLTYDQIKDMIPDLVQNAQTGQPDAVEPAKQIEQTEVQSNETSQNPTPQDVNEA